jgi:hypothetical protein
MLPIVAPLFVNASWSSLLWRLPVIATVAEANVDALTSITAKPESITTGVELTLSPAVNDAEPESVVTAGRPSTSTVSVAAALFSVPSLTANETVRLPSVALDPDEKLTTSNAFCHCASVDVAPAEVSVSTPVVES